MSSSREEFLNKVRNSLRGALLPEAGPEHPGAFGEYSFRADAPPDELAAEFKRELEALSGYVHLVEDVEEIGPEIAAIARQHGASRILAWDAAALEMSWLEGALAEAGIGLVHHRLSADKAGRQATLDDIEDVVIGLTGAQGGLANTGTVALVSGPGRGRLASLLPPVHIALLSKRKLYPALPAFLAANPEATAEGSNLVFISGPSRTGDIEMTLSMGVHGPGEIHVIIMP